MNTPYTYAIDTNGKVDYNNKVWDKNFVRYYKVSKSLAQKSGLTFRLTIEQTAQLWFNDWANRTEYRMCRKNIKYGFTPANTHILTREEHRREIMLRHKNPSPPGQKDFWQWAEPRRVRIYDLQYDSLGDAKRELGVAKSTIRQRCGSDTFPDWQYIDPPRYEAA